MVFLKFQIGTLGCFPIFNALPVRWKNWKSINLGHSRESGNLLFPATYRFPLSRGWQEKDLFNPYEKAIGYKKGSFFIFSGCYGPHRDRWWCGSEY
jgi:hypothetical protein